MQELKKAFIEVAEKNLKETGKTTLVPSDLTGTFALGHDAEDEWWDKIADESTFINDIGIRMIETDDIYSNELTLGANGEDILRPGSPGVDPGDTVTMGSAERSFKPQETVAILPVSDDLLESIKDGEAAWQHFLGMVAKAEINSLESAILHGVQAGQNNTQRGSVTGMFDGILEQIRALGNVVDATDSSFNSRVLTIDGDADDKLLIAGEALPSKYDGPDKFWFMDFRMRQQIAALYRSKGFAVADRFLQDGPYGSGIDVHGVPTYPVRKLRTNFLVQGTGTMSGGASQVNGNGVAKARSSSITVDDTTGFANGNTGVIGALSAAAAYGINAELFTVNGAPSGTVIATLAALNYDHDDNEYVNEYSAAPTANGRYAFRAGLDNMRLVVRRGHRVEFFREPRKRQTSVVITRKIIPAVMNPEATVLLRDLLVR